MSDNERIQREFDFILTLCIIFFILVVSGIYDLIPRDYRTMFVASIFYISALLSRPKSLTTQPSSQCSPD